MNDPKSPELFAERPVRSDFARPGPSYALRRLITLLVLAAIIGGALYWKLSGPTSLTPGSIPTIRADGGYKQRPQQPGGIDIPNQDIQAYQALDNKPPQPEVEHLLPPSETPQNTALPGQATVDAPLPADEGRLESLTATPAPPVVPRETIATSSVMGPAKNAPRTVTTAGMAPAPDAAPIALVTTATTPPTTATPSTLATRAAAPAAPVMPTVAKTVAPVRAAAPKAAPAQPTIDQVLKDVTVSPKTGTVIQLASVPDQDNAQAVMQKLQSKYASILGSTPLRVVRADLGAKGIYYRIQSGPLAEDRAKNICAELKDAKAGCILVRP